MRKSVLFAIGVILCSIGAFFIGAYFVKDTQATSDITNSQTVLSEAERRFADNPDNVFVVLAETRALLAGTSKDKIELQRAQLKLQRATDAFFQKNLDAIALSSYRKHGAQKYVEAYENHSSLNIKADVSPTYADILKKNLLDNGVNPKNREFQAYAYILWTLSENPRSQTGATLDRPTLLALTEAEKWALKNTSLQLSDEEMITIFDKLGYLPWRSLDLKSMRRTIVSEWLSIRSRYTRAYLTAQMMFGRNALGNRIYLRNTLKHTKQISSLSCEANSFAHFYNYHASLSGHPTITEKDAFELFPVDDLPPELDKTPQGFKRRWWDPEKSFVGKVEGVQSANINKLTGYGIHAKWVEPILRDKLKPLGYTTRLANMSELTIVSSLSRNQPILFWYVYTDDPKKWFAKLDWTTWDGQERTGYIGEHTGIIVGVELTKGGEISKVGYYEGLSEAIIWEDWKSLKNKAKYFDQSIIAVGANRP